MLGLLMKNHYFAKIIKKKLSLRGMTIDLSKLHEGKEVTTLKRAV
jgi:hypothetical protein